MWLLAQVVVVRTYEAVQRVFQQLKDATPQVGRDAGRPAHGQGPRAMECHSGHSLVLFPSLRAVAQPVERAVAQPVERGHTVLLAWGEQPRINLRRGLSEQPPLGPGLQGHRPVLPSILSLTMVQPFNAASEGRAGQVGGWAGVAGGRVCGGGMLGVGLGWRVGGCVEVACRA